MHKEDDTDSPIAIIKFIVLPIIGLAVLIFWVRKNAEDYKNGIAKDYSIVKGQIFKYEEDNDVEGRDRYMTYSYMVNGLEYYRKISSAKIWDCIDSNGELTSDCRSKSFWVLYSNSDHGKSVINPDPIGKDTIPNINLDNFY